MIIIKSKRISFLMSICFFILMLLFCSYAEERTIEISSRIYEFDKNDYDFANMHEVNQLVSGEASLGKLSISGDISKDSTLMGGMDNFGVESGVINFSYNSFCYGWRQFNNGRCIKPVYRVYCGEQQLHTFVITGCCIAYVFG